MLKPLRTVLLDRNMAAALFVKYGFDKDGLLPYVVFINALCETPARWAQSVWGRTRGFLKGQGLDNRCIFLSAVPSNSECADG